MLTRREMIAGMAMAAVSFKVPGGACDCHTHVFGDPARFPLSPARSYTPEQASTAELKALHRALHIDRVVVVQPSIYGTDNSCTLAAIKEYGASRARGVAVIGEDTTEAALEEMDRGGIRGIRLNLATGGVTPADAARKRIEWAVARLSKRSWHIQILTTPPVLEAVKDLILAAPMPFVFDHFGGMQGALALGQPGFSTLLDLVRGGKAYVKISAAYRSSTKAPDYADVGPLARALIAANPSRILWGSDWPHPDSSQVAGRKATDIAPLYKIDDGHVFSLLASWAPEASLREKILVQNPAKLYRF